MARCSVWAIGLVVLSVCLSTAVATRDPSTAAVASAIRDKKSGGACLKLEDEAACLSNECSWCTGTLLEGGACLANQVAKLLPTSVAECKSSEDPEPTQLTNKGGKKPKLPASCGDNKEKRDCLDLGAGEGDCAWCEGDFMPASCVAVKAAEWIPGTVAKCKLPKKKHDDKELASSGGDDPAPKKKAAVSCGDNKEKHDCLELGAQEGDCAWCKGDFMPPSCVAVKAAEWIPGTVAKCKLPKKKVAPSNGAEPNPGPGPTPGPGMGCMSAKTKKECMKAKDFMGGCAWCKSEWQGESCMGESQAKYLPGAKCKFPKHKDEVVAAAATELERKKHHDDKKGGGGIPFFPGGGDIPYIPGGGGSGAGPQPGPGGGGCMGAKTKRDCLKAKDYMGGGCAWCESQWQGESCMAETQAKFQPMAKCKFPKGRKVESS